MRSLAVEVYVVRFASHKTPTIKGPKRDSLGLGRPFAKTFIRALFTFSLNEEMLIAMLIVMSPSPRLLQIRVSI